MEPLDKETFLCQMHRAEKQSGYSENALKRFYNWMYDGKRGKVQVCAFPVPPEGKDKHEMGKGKWTFASNYEEFKEFAYSYSDTWQYHVYSAVNTIDDVPDTGRGGIDCFDRINHLSFDIETERESYSGASHEEVWWCYKYALAQAKWMLENYGVEPLIVMSENGIHLHYNVDFSIDDAMLDGKQHLYTKYLTHKAMNSKYAKHIEQKAPDSVVFGQDDVSDVPRIMKVAGTMGIKSENGRMCGIIHEPHGEVTSPLFESDITIEESELKDLFDSDDGDSEDIEPVEVTPNDANDDVIERVKHLCRNDEEFREYWKGTHPKTSDRSAAEFAFVVKMLNHNFSVEEINQVMWACGIGKWQEESDHYREKTMSEAIDYFDGNYVNDSRTSEFSFTRK